jgi:plastocyanin
VAALSGSQLSDARATSIRLDQGGSPVVAFGDGDRTVVASQTGGAGGAWAVNTVSTTGGFGVSLAIDKDGKGHLVFYDGQGGVHEATGSGSSWQVADVAATSAASGPDARWSTGIGVDDQGTEYLAWADTKADAVVFATGKPGALRTQPLSGSLGGTNPSLASTPDGSSIAVAWYDSVDQNLEVATPPAGGLAIAFSPAPPAATAAPSPTAQCEAKGSKLTIVAKSVAFDTNCLAAPAGKPFTLTFDNEDSGIPHNVAIYKGPGPTSPLFQGEVFNGVKTQDYQVTAIPAGTYYFQCDVHGAAMSGTFVSK